MDLVWTGPETMGGFGDELAAVAGALERMGIRYLIGGSVASSARGVPRMTLDVDLLAEMRAEQAAGLAAELGAEWYADADSMRAALAAGRPFNVIHMGSGQKFDIFPAVSEFHESELERASRLAVTGAGGQRYPVASQEDILLAKLVWYRRGGEVSDRQWSDVVGLAGGAAELDGAYLEKWAERLGVRDLLDRAWR